MESVLREKLKYEGLWDYTSDDLRFNQSSGFVGKAFAKYTSKTCSRCGFVMTNDVYRDMLERITREGTAWKTFLRDREMLLDGEITYFNKYKRENISVLLSEELESLSAEESGKPVTEWTARRRGRVMFLIKKRYSHRPEQEKFICLDCGYKAHADEQAALNVARAWVFLQSRDYVKYKKTRNHDKAEKGLFVNAWQSFYKRMLKESW